MLKIVLHVSKIRHHQNHNTPLIIMYPYNTGAKCTRQYAKKKTPLLFLIQKGITFVQSVTGSFVYYARVIDGTMLHALNDIASKQDTPKVQTKYKCLCLLDYTSTYPHAYIHFYASDLLLCVNTGIAYFALPKAQSHIASKLYMVNLPTSKPHPSLNGTLIDECKA